jgi:hypothetical protein
MAPRILESKAQFLERLKRGAQALATGPIGFGQHHFSLAVVLEEGRYRVRRLVLPPGKAEAYLKEHGMFMPEHAEMLSEPIGEIVFEAETLEGLISLIEKARWPM